MIWTPLENFCNDLDTGIFMMEVKAEMAKDPFWGKSDRQVVTERIQDEHLAQTRHNMGPVFSRLKNGKKI